MINVDGVNPGMPPNPVDAVGPANAVSPNASPSPPADVVEISSIARLAAKIQELPDVRPELIERVKTEIASGTYETPDRLEIAIDRLMEDLFPGT